MTRYARYLAALVAGIFLFLACDGPLSTTQLMVNTEDCIGCGECVEVCPYNAVEIINGDAVIDPSLCHFCYRCVEQCPEGAIY